MTPRYTVAAVDLDETLLRSDGSLSSHSAAVLAAVVARGTRLVYVTARHLDSLRDAVGHLSVPADAICCVGADAFDLSSGQQNAETTISSTAAQKITARVWNDIQRVKIGWVMGPSMFPEIPEPEEYFLNRGIAALPDGPVSKICVVASQPVTAEFHERVADAVEGVACIARMASDVVEIVAPGVDKGIALEKWCDARGIAAAQVVGFGDSAADVPMLRWAGHGVAIGDAGPEVRAAADEVAGGCDQDAVAEWLRAVLLPSGWTPEA